MKREQSTDELAGQWTLLPSERDVLGNRTGPTRLGFAVLLKYFQDLTRYRKALLQDRTREANRLHKILQDAGIKLATVATDILGVSGRAMLTALVAGTTDAAVLADLARGKLRSKLPALRQALTGRFRGHHAFLVT